MKTLRKATAVLLDSASLGRSIPQQPRCFSEAAASALLFWCWLSQDRTTALAWSHHASHGRINQFVPISDDLRATVPGRCRKDHPDDCIRWKHCSPQGSGIDADPARRFKQWDGSRTRLSFLLCTWLVPSSVRPPPGVGGPSSSASNQHMYLPPSRMCVTQLQR